jgi:hypothetical protein
VRKRTYFAMTCVLAGALCFISHFLRKVDESRQARHGDEARASESAVLAFADHFIDACARKDMVLLQEVMAPPFFVIAACQGGELESPDEFKNRVLDRGSGFPPLAFLMPFKRRIITPEEYIRSLGGDDEEVARFLQQFPGDVRVVCVCTDKESRVVGLAVFVRSGPDGLRTVAVSIGLRVTLDS